MGKCQHCGADTPLSKKTGESRRFCSQKCSHASWVLANPARRKEHVHKYDTSPKGRNAHRTWASNNLEYLRDYKASQYAESRESVLVRSAAYAAANPDKVATYKKTYAATERGKQKAHEGVWRRIARKRAAVGTFTKAAFMAMCRQVGWRCLKCLGKFAVLEADHVMPLVAGGPNSIDNIQPLCRKCNAAKGATHRDYRQEFVCQPIDLLEAA